MSAENTGVTVIKGLLEKGLKHHHAGRINEAKSVYEQALKLQPRHPDALHLAGLANLQAGDPGRAAELIQRAIEVRPGNPAFHANLAQAFLALEQFEEAHSAFERARALDPGNPQFATGAANCLAMQGRAAEAEQQLRAVVQRHPGFALAWLNLGNAVRDQGRLPESAECYRRVIALEPDFPDAHNNLGSALHGMERFDEAERSYRQYLAMQPDSVIGYCNLASLLTDCGRFAAAAAVCEEGIKRPFSPAEQSELHLAHGGALAHQGKLAAALPAFHAAANLAPGNARALWAYGYALCSTGDCGEGSRWLERALALKPDPAARYGAATAYLSAGEMQTGWREYEWRPARSGAIETFHGLQPPNQPLGSLRGRKVLLLGEQGLGDELFFLRYAAALQYLGAEISCRTSAKIISMLGRVPALARVIAPGDPIPAADLTLLIGDLPQMLGNADASPYRASAVAKSAPSQLAFPRWLRIYFPLIPPPLALAPLPERLAKIRHRLTESGPPPYIGLTWRAGTAPGQQRGASWVLHKEIPITALGAALRDSTGTFLSLQRNPAPGEIEQLAELTGRTVHDFSALNDDLESMLALLALIDDYVGVSNTNMHLRAGTGRTGRVLVPCPGEWRWMAAGRESPWFPGFRIYRQGTDGEWGVAIATLKRDLLAAFGGHVPQPDGGGPAL